MIYVSVPPVHIPPTREWADLLQYAQSVDGYGQLLLEIIWYIKNIGLMAVGVMLAVIVSVTWRG